MQDENLMARYRNIVKLYHTQGREAYFKAHAAMQTAVGKDIMERLSYQYEMEFEAACETSEGKRENEFYQ